MELIVIQNVKRQKQTIYKTTYVGGCQYKSNQTICILNDNDMKDLKKLVIKLRGYLIDTLIIPSEYGDTYYELEGFNYIAPQLSDDLKLITV